jgi:hypothetical protein
MEGNKQGFQLISVFVSFSSLEHDRYDPLNPLGDIEIVQRFRCFFMDFCFLRYHMHQRTVCNAQHIYGPVRQTLLFQSWKLLGIYDTATPWKLLTNFNYAQPVSVLQNYQKSKQEDRVSYYFHM